jgi:hypothetical protein
MRLTRLLAAHTQYEADNTWASRAGNLVTAKRKWITTTQNNKCYLFSSNNLLVVSLPVQQWSLQKSNRSTPMYLLA